MPESAQEYVLRRSFVCRRVRKDACWLVAEALDYLRRQSDLPDGRQALRGRLRAHLRECVQRDAGNPLLVWVLLNIVLPIVVRLVIEWWLNRDNGRE